MARSTKAPEKIYKEPWGFTKLDNYETCAAWFWWRFGEKRAEGNPENPAMKRGGEVHDMLERYVNGWGRAFPHDILVNVWRPMIDKLKKIGAMTEASWGLDSNWMPLRDWFQPQTWVRIKADVYYLEKDVLHVIDYKTGKYRVPKKDQVDLYAIAGLRKVPQAKKVKAAFWFIDQPDKPHVETYDAKTAGLLMKDFDKRAGKIYKDRRFEPTPGAHCRGCPFSRQKGGPCIY